MLDFKGHELWDNDEDMPNTETTYLVQGVSFLPGVRYYVNVIAYGLSGIHHTESSDGFIIDNMKPRAGVVFDGIGIFNFYLKTMFLSSFQYFKTFMYVRIFIGMYDLEYQNSSKTIGAFWHGYSDSASGVKKYFWCVGNTSSSSECSVRNWEDIGI